MIFLTMVKLDNVSTFLSSSMGGFPARKLFQDSLAKIPTVFPLQELTSETTREQRQAFLRSVPPAILTGLQGNGLSQHRRRKRAVLRTCTG